MTTRTRDVGLLLVLILGCGCSAGSDSDTASQTGKVAESEAAEPTKASADTSDSDTDAETDSDTDAETDPDTETASMGEVDEPPASPESAADDSEPDQECLTPNGVCPPPPDDWCDSNRDLPLEDWLADHWNSFCDEAPAPDAGAADTGASPPTGSEPASDAAIACGVAIGGPGASPCPPPPLDWCGTNHDPFPLPELVAYWDSTCSEAESLP